MSGAEKWSKPVPTDRADGVAGLADVSRHLPPREEIPERFWRGGDPWNQFVTTWFFEGQKDAAVRAREGVDRGAAIRHLGGVLRSFAPDHNHKIAGAAFLASLWFVEPEGVDHG